LLIYYGFSTLSSRRLSAASDLQKRTLPNGFDGRVTNFERIMHGTYGAAAIPLSTLAADS